MRFRTTRPAPPDPRRIPPRPAGCVLPARGQGPRAPGWLGHSVVAGALLVVPLLLGPGCESSSPTLPLPPPVALVEGPPDADGLVAVRVQGTPAGAFVMALNARTERGVIGRANAEGKADLRLEADLGDAIRVWYRVETRSSEPTTALVPVMPADAGPADPDSAAGGG